MNITKNAINLSSKGLSLIKNFPIRTITVFSNNLYAAKPKTLTESQIQLQKHATEMQYKPKTSLRGTDFTFHDLETSLRYMDSEAFKLAYGDEPIWTKFVRNYGGHTKPSYTREKCVRLGKYATGNPCPICRDEYLIVSYKNMKLLQQFISNATGQLYPTSVTNVCRKQQENLTIAYNKAVDLGILDHFIPFRSYDYSLYSNQYRSQEPTPDQSILLDIVLAANRKNTNNLIEDITAKDLLEIK